MRLTHPRQPPIEERCDPGLHHPHGHHTPPARFEVAGTDRRLSDDLRGPLRHPQASPVSLLAAATQALLAGDALRGQALADLSVTGRNMYQRFRASPPQLAQVLQAAGRPSEDHHARSLAGRALDRAYRVAWALQGLVPRSGLGWIAVSGEDDPPHRPVNVPGAAFPQHDLLVAVRATAHARARTLTTRFIVARPGARPTAPMAPDDGIDSRVLPPDQAVRIDENDRLLIYVHGHSSQLEECLSLAEAVAPHGFTVVAMDLPCCGYGTMFDHTEIAGDVPAHEMLQTFPVLEFIEQFIVDFVLALEARVGRPIQHQIAAVIGGSLGGNMALRLAQRDLPALPFLTSVVAWSAACVWTPKTGEQIVGPNQTRGSMNLDPPAPGAPRDRPGEPPERRAEHFHQVFEKEELPGVIKPQPTYWSRDDWPCKQQSIAGARAARQEHYNSFFRRWHWRVAHEQLLYTHSDPARWPRIRARTLFVAGDSDNYAFARIYDATQILAVRLETTPGALLLMQKTGHSIHAERPQWLAHEIRAFLPPRRPIEPVREAWTPWRGLGGTLTARPAVGVNEDGRLEAFGRGTDHRLHRLAQVAVNGPWASTWSRLDHGIEQDRIGSSIAVGRTEDGRLDVFAHLSGGDRIMHVAQVAPGGAWSQWDRGDALRQFIGKARDGVAVIDRASTSNRRWLLVAALVHDGWIHIRGQHQHGWWTSGRYLGRTTPRFVGTPVLTQNRDGRLEVFARDESGVLHHLWETGPDTWHDTWTPFGSDKVTSDAAVTLTVDGRLEAFACGPRGDLMHLWQTAPNNGWTGWASLGGSLAPGSTPAVVRNAWGELQVFVRWQDGSIRYRRLLPDRGWHWRDWESLGGNSKFDPVVAMNADGRLAVFMVRVEDGALFLREQDTTR